MKIYIQSMNMQFILTVILPHSQPACLKKNKNRIFRSNRVCFTVIELSLRGEKPFLCQVKTGRDM